MICYKDMTFCPYRDCAKFAECFRALTQQVQEGAAVEGLGICQFAEKPDCYEENAE